MIVYDYVPIITYMIMYLHDYVPIYSWLYTYMWLYNDMVIQLVLDILDYIRLHCIIIIINVINCLFKEKSVSFEEDGFTEETYLPTHIGHNSNVNILNANKKKNNPQKTMDIKHIFCNINRFFFHIKSNPALAES